MTITYFAETDTLYIEIGGGPVAETRDLDEGTLVEFDAGGRLCAITVEHARERSGASAVSFEEIGG